MDKMQLLADVKKRIMQNSSVGEAQAEEIARRWINQ